MCLCFSARMPKSNPFHKSLIHWCSIMLPFGYQIRKHWTYLCYATHAIFLHFSLNSAVNFVHRGIVNPKKIVLQFLVLDSGALNEYLSSLWIIQIFGSLSIIQILGQLINKCSDKSMEVFPPFEEFMTNRPTDKRTDRGVIGKLHFQNRSVIQLLFD